MGFNTKLDYGDNRQIKQFQLTNTVLSGKTIFGVDDIYIPLNFTGDTINIVAKQYIQTKGLIFSSPLPEFTGSTYQLLARDNATGKLVELTNFSGGTGGSGGTDTNDYVTSGSYNTGTTTLTLSRLSGGTVDINLSGLTSSPSTSNNESKVIYVNYTGLTSFSGYSASSSTEVNLANYVNSLNYNKTSDYSDIWIEYDDTDNSALVITFYTRQLERNSSTNGEFSETFPYEIVFDGGTYTLNDNAAYVSGATGELAMVTDMATLMTTMGLAITVTSYVPAGYDFDADDIYLLKHEININGLTDNLYEFIFSNLENRNNGFYTKYTIQKELDNTITLSSYYSSGNGISGPYDGEIGSTIYYDKDLNDLTLTGGTGNFPITIFQV